MTAAVLHEYGGEFELELEELELVDQRQAIRVAPEYPLELLGPSAARSRRELRAAPAGSVPRL